ncbi:hypothetical protein IB237_21685 [Agrobacterium sp. AGB01]|uniref:hypothetical protein n=1 Tax=Agrobacterium sp. AGB01 TaxID=2769302 RepID=UPI001782FC9F|nr:hypothetical protein [Agrobacterium sp. AGB01]MBD9389814.1 hypothetical protein [Agrobacterium sp. AGB01]
MSDWKTATTRMARRLRRNGTSSGLIALLLVAVAPATAGAHGFTAALGWWLLLVFCLASIALAVHLLFDARLFHLAASHESEEEALAAIDDFLARMRLRAKPAVPAPLLQRFTGCRRLILLQWSTLAIAILLYGILLLDAVDGVAT